MAVRHQLTSSTFIRISRTLFMQEDAAPYTFYFAEQLQDLQKIIHRGGGELADSPREASYVLSENRLDCKGGKYLPLQFIVDCVKRNTFLNPEKYCQAHGIKSICAQDRPSTSTARDQCEDSDDEFFTRTSNILVSESATKGRSKYTDAEDLKIIRYLIFQKKCKETGGNMVWKEMQAAKLTDHTHQSMKARFKKKILPDIDSYDIPEFWKRQLTGEDSNPRDRRFSPRRNPA
ncbi:hypothetical protein EGW08_013069, partial [Elysia chlorotica]